MIATMLALGWGILLAWVLIALVQASIAGSGVALVILLLVLAV